MKKLASALKFLTSRAPVSDRRKRCAT